MNMVEVKEKQVVVDMNDVQTPIRKIFVILIKIDFIGTVSTELKMQSHGLDSVDIVNTIKGQLDIALRNMLLLEQKSIG